jgi:DeoR/GlpR family transcriptional regulator of sugar metabolism
VLAHERRQKLIEWLCHKRHDTYDNLAQKFGVSKRTIQNDIMVLTDHYPIETVCGRYGGGIHIPDGYQLPQNRLTFEETDLLKRLAKSLCGKDLLLMNGLIARFAPY